MSTPRKRTTKYDRTVERGAAEVAQRLADAGPRYATPQEALDQAAEWTDEQLMCRTKGHDFLVPINVTHYARYRYYFVELGCTHGCGVKQVQEMNESGHVYWSKPVYPPKDGSEGVPYLSRTGRVVGDAKDAIRMETVLRVFRPRTSNKQGVEPHNGWDEAVNGGNANQAAS